MLDSYYFNNIALQSWRQLLPTLKVSSYCILALHDRIHSSHMNTFSNNNGFVCHFDIQDAY